MSLSMYYQLGLLDVIGPSHDRHGVYYLGLLLKKGLFLFSCLIKTLLKTALVRRL